MARRDVPRRLRSAWQPTQRSTAPTNRAAWAMLTGETIPPSSSRYATRDEALSLPAFGRGVELLSSAVAGVDLVAQKWDPAAGIWARTSDQPTILTDPHPDGTPWHWRYSATKDLIEAGNHVALLGDMDWLTGRPGWLIPLPVASLGLVTNTADPGWYAFTMGGVLLDPSEVLHISAGNRSGEVLGQGIIAQYSETLGQQLTAEEWSARYLTGGGLPPAIIQVSGMPTQTQLTEFKGQWNTLTQTGEAIVLPSTATITPLQSDAQSQQLVEARTWNAQLAAMVLGIPSHMLGLPGPSMTYQNVETADIGWIKDSVSRWAQPIEATMSKVLLPRGTRARFDWAGRLRTDQKTQVEVVTGYVGAGVWSVDEGRQTIGYAPMQAAHDEGTTPEGTPDLGTKETA